MGGVGFLILVAMIIAGAVAFVKIDNKSEEPDPTKSKQYRELQRQHQAAQLAVSNIKEIAQTFSETNAEGGILADLILREIPEHNRKELDSNG